MRTWMGLISLACLAVPGQAFAQSFPADNQWLPFQCGNRPMRDGVRDQSAAVDERDLVGDLVDPAGYRSIDDRFLYLRLRVDEAPTMGANLRPFAWGYAFSTDGDHDDYEVLITLDGDARSVGLYRNSVTTVPRSPTDPADSPPVATYPFATHGRTVAAQSSFRSTPDHFIDLAVPWSALTPLGLGDRQAVAVWAASSTAADRLNGDFACHDAGGGNGTPDLRGSASDSTTAAGNPGGTGGTGGTGAGGSGGSAGALGAGGTSLEGGPGCNTARTAASATPTAPLLLALLLWLRTRRR